MKQTKIESFIEVCINVAIGYVVSMLVTVYIIVPVWKLDWDTNDSLVVTLIFTVTAIIRGMVVRRFFNAGLHKVVHRVVRGIAIARWNKK